MFRAYCRRGQGAISPQKHQSEQGLPVINQVSCDTAILIDVDDEVDHTDEELGTATQRASSVD